MGGPKKGRCKGEQQRTIQIEYPSGAPSGLCYDLGLLAPLAPELVWV